MARLRVAIICFSWVARDPRVRRQIRALAAEHEIEVVGFGPAGIDGVRSTQLDPAGRALWEKAVYVIAALLRIHPLAYRTLPHIRRARAVIAALQADVVVVNDLEPLPLALAAHPRVMCDAHEYAPEEWADSAWWRLLTAPLRRWLCARWLPRCRAMTTVCAGIAQRYREEFGVAPTVVMNASERVELAPSEPDPGRIRLVHHGAALRARHLERMLEVLDRLDQRFELDLMLTPGDPGYLGVLEQAVKGRRARLVPPVPMEQVAAALNRYDVGVYLLEPTSFNHRHALPNKLFEFIQARLAIAIGPSPEMAAIVAERGLGIVAPSFAPDDLARALTALDADAIRAFKRASHAAADSLNAAADAATVRQAVVRAAGA
jgi:hypothetical protein